MPRGNDPAAGRELTSQYGEGAGNAEDLIQLHSDSRDTEMNAALNKPVDTKATDELDLDKLPTKYDGVIVSAAVRGGGLVVVEDVDGNYVKWFDPEFAGGKGQRRKPKEKDEEKAPAPALAPAESVAPGEETIGTPGVPPGGAPGAHGGSPIGTGFDPEAEEAKEKDASKEKASKDEPKSAASAAPKHAPPPRTPPPPPPAKPAPRSGGSSK